MKTFIILLFTVFSVGISYTQISEGTVEFVVIHIDTTDNDTIQDSTLVLHSFKGENSFTKFENGSYSDTRISTTAETIFLENSENGNFCLRRPGNVNSDQILNQVQDPVLFETQVLPDHKTIAGFTCKRASITFLSDGEQATGSTYIWYTDQVKGNDIIFGVGTETLHINGLILEYELHNEYGITIRTASNVNIGNVSDAIFAPDLNGYTIMD